MSDAPPDQSSLPPAWWRGVPLPCVPCRSIAFTGHGGPTDPRSLDPIFRDDDRAMCTGTFDTDAPVDMSIRPWAPRCGWGSRDMGWSVSRRHACSTNGGRWRPRLRFNLERIVNPDNKSPIRSLISPLGKLRSRTGARWFHTANPDPLFTARLIWLQMVPPEYATEAGACSSAPARSAGSGTLKRWQRTPKSCSPPIGSLAWRAGPRRGHLQDHSRGDRAVSALRPGDVNDPQPVHQPGGCGVAVSRFRCRSRRHALPC